MGSYDETLQNARRNIGKIYTRPGDSIIAKASDTLHKAIGSSFSAKEQEVGHVIKLLAYLSVFEKMNGNRDAMANSKQIMMTHSEGTKNLDRYEAVLKKAGFSVVRNSVTHNQCHLTLPVAEIDGFLLDNSAFVKKLDNFMKRLPDHSLVKQWSSEEGGILLNPTNMKIIKARIEPIAARKTQEQQKINDAEWDATPVVPSELSPEESRSAAHLRINGNGKHPSGVGK